MLESNGAQLNDETLTTYVNSCPLTKWRLVRIVEVYESTDGYVRWVKLMVANDLLDDNGRCTKPPRFLECPVQKVVLLQKDKENV